MGVPDVVKLVLAGGGGAAITETARRLIPRPGDRARRERIEVATIRVVLTEVRTELGQVRSRVAKLEERERHMLTRAAVHEAWDQMSFALLTTLHPEHPAPPPLMPPRELDDPDNRDAY